MKPMNDSLRNKIDLLRKGPGNDAYPNWHLDVFRDQEKMLGRIDGAPITGGIGHAQPAIAHHTNGRYTVVFSSGGDLYETVSSDTNRPQVSWSNPVVIGAGTRPDLDYDGSFDTIGRFTPSALMLVYERAGGVLFRKKEGGAWGPEHLVSYDAEQPSIVRGWKDPPSIAQNDMGIQVFYIADDRLARRESVTGTSWSAPEYVNMPPGGVKRNPHVYRMADYTIGIVYEYDNGLKTDIFFLKAKRFYYNMASPDEYLDVGAGNFRHYTWEHVQVDGSSETTTVGAGGFRHDIWTHLEAQSIEEDVVVVGAGGFRQAEFTGVSP